RAERSPAGVAEDGSSFRGVLLMSVTTMSRDITLDVARGIAIVLLVYAHGLEVLFNSRPDGMFDMAAFVQWQFICTFDVPLFFLISGASHRNIARKTFREVAE